MKNSKTLQSIVPYLSMKEADKAIEFYKKAFNAKEIGRITIPGGKIGHAELEIGNAKIMVAEEIAEWGNKGPETLGGSPVGIFLYVDDVDTMFKNALAAGAKVEGNMDVKDQFYGERSGNLIDPFGHKWTIATHIENVSYEEMQKRSDKLMEDAAKK